MLQLVRNSVSNREIDYKCLNQIKDLVFSYLIENLEVVNCCSWFNGSGVPEEESL